jgi:hypothetical protein
VRSSKFKDVPRAIEDSRDRVQGGASRLSGAGIAGLRSRMNDKRKLAFWKTEGSHIASQQ